MTTCYNNDVNDVTYLITSCIRRTSFDEHRSRNEMGQKGVRVIFL